MLKSTLFSLSLAIAQAAPPAATFYKDVLPILQQRCQECHRPGEIGPMPLLTYAQVRPWAKAIKAAVIEGKMPPWPADARYGKFSNDLSLTPAQIQTLTAWADAGAKEGNPSDAPPPRKWSEGWNIGTPDVVLEMPQPFDIPASGTVEYQYLVLPTGFAEDKWVQAVEVRPSAREVVHHAIAYARVPGAKWLADAKPGVPFVPATLPDGRRRISDTTGGGAEIIGVYNPGIRPDIWQPGQAKKIEAGSDLILQIHYTANGKANRDQTRIGIVFAKRPPAERIVTIPVMNISFRIPAGDANYTAEGQTPVINPMKIVSVFPHMHLRGKSFRFDVTYPGGKSETLLKLKRWDLNWQLDYKLETPLQLPIGTWIRATGWWDNSANNPANPDPKADVTWGEQSWEEMLVGFVQIAVDPKFDNITIFGLPRLSRDRE